MKPTFTLNQTQDCKVYFTSDTHYSHKNIVAGESDWVKETGRTDRCRQFATRDQMNDALVNCINQRVGSKDILVHLGDWSFGGFDEIQKFRDRLNVERIYLLLGNHDHHIENNKNNIQSLFQWVGHYARIEVKDHKEDGQVTRYNYIAQHFPIASWDMLSKGWIHIHGHVHFEQNKKIGPGRMLDVGVDGNQLSPYSTAEINRLVGQRPKVGLFQTDHHND